ncbi:hypothetical protein LXA43DRAFT_844651, partial [Ganoderma leucocontextum]
CGPHENHLHASAVLPRSPLPQWHKLEALTHEHRISGESNIFNLLFSLAVLEMSAKFAEFDDGPPAFFAVGGYIYH